MIAQFANRDGCPGNLRALIDVPIEVGVLCIGVRLEYHAILRLGLAVFPTEGVADVVMEEPLTQLGHLALSAHVMEITRRDTGKVCVYCEDVGLKVIDGKEALLLRS